jgi:hypothetical protein
MVLKRIRCAVLVAAGVAAMVAVLSAAGAAQAYEPVSPDLFYNYYVPPGPYGGVGAQLYPSPRPVPPVVGGTYITYQPLMPHEFMYHHYRTYSRGGPEGRTRTRVLWW